MEGKLIVIEGVDSSGKATQTKKLIENLREEGQDVETFDFPRHGKKFFGLLVDKYLNNEFGDATKLDAHIASLFFACDRWEAKDMINNWLKEGKTVILDRYATSNMAHQAVKMKDKKDEFLEWLHELEFEVFKIPKPDQVLYLDVPIKIVTELMDKREGKEYINGDKDGHESDTGYLKATRQIYLYLCEKYDYWQIIECTGKDGLLTREEIADSVIENLKKIK